MKLKRQEEVLGRSKRKRDESKFDIKPEHSKVKAQPSCNIFLVKMFWGEGTGEL